MNNNIFIAEIVGTHALKGGLKVRVEDENPKRFLKGRILYLGEEESPVTVKSYQSKGNYGILYLEEITSIHQAEDYIGDILSVPEEELPILEEGSYYIKDLISLDVIDMEGNQLGKMKDVLSYASNDVFVLEDQKGKEYLIPSIKEIVQDINLEEAYIRIKVMDGLFDEN